MKKEIVGMVLVALAIWGSGILVGYGLGLMNEDKALEKEKLRLEIQLLQRSVR